MKRAATIGLIVTTLAFFASTMAYALYQPEVVALPLAHNEMLYLLYPASYLNAPPQGVDLADLFLRPQSPVMVALLAMTWAALAYHALRSALHVWQEPVPASATAGGTAQADPAVPRAPKRSEHGPLMVGLGLGGLWPWLGGEHPLWAFLLAALMLAAFLTAAMCKVQSGTRYERSSTLGFVAGWALLVCFSVMAALLQAKLGVPQVVAAVIAMLVGAVATVSVQLRLGHRIGFSVAVIWGLIGIAAGTVTSDATIATVTVLAIAIIAVALVRVTT